MTNARRNFVKIRPAGSHRNEPPTPAPEILCRPCPIRSRACGLRSWYDKAGGNSEQKEHRCGSRCYRANPGDARPQVHLAARPGVLTAGDLATAVDGTVGRYSPYAVYLTGGDPGQLDAVRDGVALVQDEGSQSVARALTLAPIVDDRGRWLDLCAGPGGKPRCSRRSRTRGARQQRRGVGASVTAIEPNSRRAEFVEENTRGLSVDVLRVDGRDPGIEPGFDRVLVDAPCTGLGALRRRPEARWRRLPSDVPPLARLQRELLASAIKLTRPGGVVLYATCSPHLSETVGVVADALRRHQVTVLDARPLFEGVEDLGDGPYVQLWPHRHGTDAMFAAALLVG